MAWNKGVGLLCVSALFIGGCADTPHADAAYGSSYHQIMQAQVYNVNAAAEAGDSVPASIDGKRLEKALDTYRTDVAKGSGEVKQQVVFDVGTMH